jgi:DNA polymerase/3'-5' exonuclease PolX
MKQKLPLKDAEKIASLLLTSLRPCCQRIEIAGSIRRRKSEIGDIEIVAIPVPSLDMFSNPSYEPHLLDLVNWKEYGEIIKSGHKYKQIALTEGINLDLFIVTPPAQWGVQFLIRTGSADFSHRFVTTKHHGGLLPGYLKVKDGAIWSHNHIIETPEEIDVFNLAGVPYVEPEMRTA